MRILVFDNYDSFTYNLVHLVEKLTDADVDVFRNDQVSLEEINNYDKIILSPGPGLPKDAGLLMEVIKKYAEKKSILGVCLGHQAIGEVFGGKLINLEQVYHGVATPVTVNQESGIGNRESGIVNRESGIGNRESGIVNRESGIGNRESGIGNERLPVKDRSAKISPLPIAHSSLFDGLPSQIEAGRYHSWVISEENFPEELEITSRDENGYIMALQHKKYNVQGVQFHPESILTPCGETILANWLKL
jgi:anthranilate synthase component II